MRVKLVLTGERKDLSEEEDAERCRVSRFGTSFQCQNIATRTSTPNIDHTCLGMRCGSFLRQVTRLWTHGYLKVIDVGQGWMRHAHSQPHFSSRHHSIQSLTVPGLPTSPGTVSNPVPVRHPVTVCLAGLG
jgi:hypothetical protein